MALSLSPTQRLKIAIIEKKRARIEGGRGEGWEARKTIVSRVLSFFPLSSLPSTQKRLRLRRRKRMAYYEERAPIGFCCVLSRLNCRPEAFFVARGGILRARHEGEIADTPGIRRFLYFHHFECIVLYAVVYPGVYCMGAQRFTPSIRRRVTWRDNREILDGRLKLRICQLNRKWADLSMSSPLLPQEKIGIFSGGRRGRLYTGYDKAHLLKYIPIKHLPAMEATSNFMNTDIFSFSSINEIFFSLLFVDLNLRIMRLNLFVKRTLLSCWCMIEQLDNWLMLQFNRLISRGSHITQFYHLLKSATFSNLPRHLTRSFPMN